MPHVAEGSDAAPTVGAALERLRLAHRARRIELVLEALRVRAKEAQPSPETTPAGLVESIADFSRELAQVRERLARSPGRSPAATAGLVRGASA